MGEEVELENIAMADYYHDGVSANPYGAYLAYDFPGYNSNVLGCVDGVAVGVGSAFGAAGIGILDIIAVAEPTPLGELLVAPLNLTGWSLVAGGFAYAVSGFQDCASVFSNVYWAATDYLSRPGLTANEQAQARALQGHASQAYYFASDFSAFVARLQRLSSSAINKLKKCGCDPHNMKPKNAGSFDLFVDPLDNDIYYALKDANGRPTGHPEWVGVNMDDIDRGDCDDCWQYRN
jgi:hypothetical protein